MTLRSASASFVSFLFCLFFLSGCDAAKLNVPTALGGATDLVKAATLSDAEVRSLALRAAEQSDSENQIAPPSSKYAVRLEQLTNRHTREGGISFNFKAYVTSDVNAFAMADGTVRVYSGLMDKMDDDELRFVIGHELGHAVLGHSKKQMQVAYTASAARKGIAAQGGVVGSLAASELGGLAHAVINAQFSQSEEQAADDYGMQFVKKNNYKPAAAVSALQKLAQLGGSHSFLSSHPDPQKRAERLRAQF